MTTAETDTIIRHHRAAHAADTMQESIHRFLERTAAEFIRSLDDLNKAAGDTVKNPRNIVRHFDPDWEELAGEIEPELEAVAQSSAADALDGLEVSDAAMLSHVNQVAGKWAEDRAAELVGMRRLSDGSLIENPRAHYAISETTRDSIRDIVAEAFENGATIQELTERIRSADTFSADRAQMIAETEAARAATMGNLVSWKESGLVETVSVVMSADNDTDDECDDAAEGGPDSLDDVPDLPIHPRCTCSLRIESLAGEEEEEAD